MDYKINPKRLTIALSLFAAVIVVGLITFKAAELKYELSASEAVQVMSEEQDDICFREVSDILEKSTPGYAFIDLRNPYDFLNGHIEGAKNISPIGLLEKENIKMFNDLLDDSIIMVLYGDNQSAVNGAVQVLRQVGYPKTLAMTGGYVFFVNGSDSIRPDSIPDHLAETAWYDYASVLGEKLIFESVGEASATAKPVATTTIAPVRPRVKSKPVLVAPADEDEPEGC